MTKQLIRKESHGNNHFNCHSKLNDFHFKHDFFFFFASSWDYIRDVETVRGSDCYFNRKWRWVSLQDFDKLNIITVLEEEHKLSSKSFPRYDRSFVCQVKIITMDMFSPYYDLAKQLFPCAKIVLVVFTLRYYISELRLNSPLDCFYSTPKPCYKSCACPNHESVWAKISWIRPSNVTGSSFNRIALELSDKRFLSLWNIKKRTNFVLLEFLFFNLLQLTKPTFFAYSTVTDLARLRGLSHQGHGGGCKVKATNWVGTTIEIGERVGWTVVRTISSVSLATFSSAIVRTLAPRAATSWIFPQYGWQRTGSDKRAKTGVPSSIKAMVPCLSSPAAKPSHWM